MDDAGVPTADRVPHEHVFILDVREWAVCYDQLEVTLLACFKVISRRIQLLEEACSANPKAPKCEGSEHF